MKWEVGLGKWDIGRALARALARALRLSGRKLHADKTCLNFYVFQNISRLPAI